MAKDGQLPDLAEHEAESLIQIEPAAVALEVARILWDVAAEGSGLVHAVPDSNRLLIIKRGDEGQPLRKPFLRPDLQRVEGRVGAAVQVP